MKAIKKCSKFLAVLLTVLTIVSILPMQTFATEYQNHQTLTTIDTEADEELPIKEEVVEKRTANSKTYLLEDGTYCSLTTTAPIHTYENGEWNNISTVSEQPETVEEAMSQLSSLQSTSANTSVDDGFVVSASDQSISLWGIDDEDNITTNSVTLNQSTVGILKCNIDSESIYTKTEVTVKADLRLSCGMQEANTITIRSIYSDWNIDNLSLAAIESDFENPIIDYNSIDNAGRYVWDITSEYIKWENGSLKNNGMLLYTEDSVATIYNGILRRQYRVIDDNDLGFTYHDIDMGRAGTLYINDYTNVPYLVRDELALDGNILPVSVTRFINTGVENNSFGAGGRWNYESKLSKNADTYIWDMFNGSSARFQRAVPIETDDAGREKWVEYQYNAQGYTLWIDTTKSRDYDYSNNRIVDESGNIYTFNYYGLVNSVISGANENDVLTITYSGETISSITDGIGRKYSFTYGTINNRSVVTKISVYTTAGDSETPIEIMSENSDGNGTPVEITFENEIINNKERLSKATYADGKSVEYTYDSIGRLTGIKNIDGSLLELNYAVSASEIGQNISPIFAHRLSGYTKKCLNENEEYITEYTVNINAENAYHRIFEQKNSQDTVVFSETLQFNRNLDLLYMTNSAGDCFYADYDNSHTLLSLVIPDQELQSTNIIRNSTMEKRVGGTYPKEWTKPSNITQSHYSSPKHGENNDNYYVNFDNSLDQVIYLSQENSIEGSSGDKYVLSSWGLGNATIPREDHFWGIRVFAENSEGELILIHQMSFDVSLWGEEQFRATAFSLPFDTTSITIQMVSDQQLGEVAFDDVYLYKADNAYVAAVDDAATESICKCEGCEYPFCTCACETEESCTCVSCDMKTTSTNDAHGNPLETQTTNGLTNLVSKNEYTADGNYLSKYIDENDVSTSYEYSLTNGLLLSEKLANDSTVSYGYDAIGMLKSVSQDVTNVLTGNTVTMNTEYSYENDRIKSITHNGFSYTYDYDIYGNIESISVGDTELVSYEYNDDYFNNISKITYANGAEIIYSYDNKDNIIGIKFNGDTDWRYTYTYDEYNQLKSFTDNVSKRITTYNKIIDGIKYVEVVETLGDNSKVIYGVTEEQNGEYTQSVFGKDYSIKTETNFDSDTGYSQTKMTAGTVVFGEDGTIENICTKDAFERIVSDYMTMHTNSGQLNDYENAALSLKNEYTYKNPSETKTTRLVDTFTSTVYLEAEGASEILRSISLKYDYDNAGRITMISVPETNNGVTSYYSVNIYEYDEAGNLVIEANMGFGSVCSYTYDAGGNLASKNYHDNAEYNEATHKIDLGEPTQTITYEYDSVWKDKLISYNGIQINYDALGNPLNYTANVFNTSEVNMNLEWDGRLLTAATAVDGSARYEYLYDANGLRTEKIIYKGETVTQEVLGADGNVTIEEEHIFVPFVKFEYIWSNDVPAGYRIMLYSTATDEEGNPILDAEGNEVAGFYEENSIIVNVIYNDNGETLGVNCHSESEGEENSLTFLFVKDAQGNIVSIEAFEGEYFFNFVYDAFGNVMLDISGAAIDRIQQNINNADCLVEKLIYAIGGVFGVAAVTGITFACVPNAYKGYIYDLETGLYYCQSRYYSPEWGRFINTDDTSLLELTTGDVHGANLFAYCGNDPVNNIDPTGFLGKHWYNKVSNVAKAIDIAIIAITAGKSLVGIKAIRAFLKANRRKLVQNVTKQLTKMIGSYAATFLPAAIDAALTLFGTSIGDLIARGLNWVDPLWKKGYARSNGYILN